MSLTALLNVAASSGLTTGCTAKISGWRQNGSMAREITVRPPIERYCFGPPDPARSPRPAATMIAAVRFGLGMGIGQRQCGGVKLDVAPRGAQPLITQWRENRRTPIAVCILLHCTCNMPRNV